MPREARKLVNNGVYHVMLRGHNRAKLFECSEDHRRFLSTLARYKKEFPFHLYHYCLMPNHVHLLLKIGIAENLQKFMHRLATSYSYYSRKIYDRVGYVFQGRFKSLLIEDDAYLLDCGRYIERNPVRAEIVRDVADYKWSSYNYYAFNMPDYLITTNPLFIEIAASLRKRQKEYRRYIELSRNYEILIDGALGLKP